MSIFTYTRQRIATLAEQLNFKKEVDGVVVIKQNRVGGITAKIIRSY